MKKGASFHAIGRARCGQHTDIPTSAEPTPLRMIDHDRLDRGIATPSFQRLKHALTHGQIQRMQSLRSVQPNTADRPFTLDDQIIGHAFTSKAPSPRLRVSA
jgi:hypothetical protein